MPCWSLALSPSVPLQLKLPYNAAVALLHRNDLKLRKYILFLWVFLFAFMLKCQFQFHWREYLITLGSLDIMALRKVTTEESTKA